MHPPLKPDFDISYQIFYQFNHQIFVFLRTQLSFSESIGRKDRMLQPLLEYFDKAKQNREDDGNSEMFYQLQRYLLILQSFDIKEPEKNKFIQDLSRCYYSAANSFVHAIQKKTWYEHQLSTTRHEYFSQDMMLQLQKMVSTDTQRIDVSKVSISELIVSLGNYVQIYVDRRDTWYSKRSNELLLLAQHISCIIQQYKNKFYWVQHIYNDGFHPNLTAREAIRLTDEEQLCYYLLYQICEFIYSPFSKNRDKELDGVFNKYLHQVIKREKLDSFQNRYEVFIKRILHAQKISRFITSDLFNSSIVEQVHTYSHLNKPILILERLARLAGIVSVTHDVRCPYNTSDLVHNFQSYYSIFTRPSVLMTDYINKKLYRAYNPEKIDRQSDQRHVFLALFFLMEFKKITRNLRNEVNGKEIFWAIFYLRSNKTSQKDRKNFMNGALNEVIAGFHLYSCLQSQFREHESIYRTVIENIGAYDRSIGALISTIFPDETSMTVASIRHEMLLFLNWESEA